MGRYDKFSVTKIEKIISDTQRSAELMQTTTQAIRPKAQAVSAQRGHRHMMDELQGE